MWVLPGEYTIELPALRGDAGCSNLSTLAYFADFCLA